MMNATTENLNIDCETELAICDELKTLGRMAHWYTGDPAAAEDLVQDTMVLALRFMGSYKQGTNLRAWLLRVMRNRYISINRRRTLERRVYETEGRHALTDWSIGEAGRRSMARNGDVERDNSFSDPVFHAINSLRPEFRNAVLMCDVEELSYAEAAERAECPVGTIMSRLHRGRRALRTKLVSRHHLEAA
jgi:RNA polymerase sigma-70 factor, ECF subfamily